MAAAGEVAVEAVGDAGEDEDDGGDDLLLAVRRPVAPWPPVKGKAGESIQMSRGTQAMRLIVMELGRFMDGFCWRSRGDVRGADTSILP